MWLVRAFSSLFFLTAIVLSVPLAFDVGGRECGIAFSLSLASFYFFFSLLRLTTPANSHVRRLVIFLIRSSQALIVPALLIWSLDRFSSDVDVPLHSSSPRSLGWLGRMLHPALPTGVSLYDSVFGREGLIEVVTVRSWDSTLSWSTPVFQLAEGFCSLLVIQACGQITRWLVNRGGRSDTWMISLLVLSASVISSSLYFLWRVLQFPRISNVDSALIGVAVTCAVILCAWGIGSGRGNPVESSLLFAYVVLCIYQIFTDYQPLHPSTVQPLPAQTADFPPLPPIIMESYTTITHALSALPRIIQSAFNVFYAAFSVISPSVLVSLTYRLFVFYASTRIIPAVHVSGGRALSQEASLEDSDAAGQFLALLSWFSPSILVAVYTSLLMQHFATTSQSEVAHGADIWWTNQGSGGGILWRWVNLACTMGLYAIELWLGKHDDIDTGMHWKND
ncbi:hypothetical protein KEM56_007251 [Ascosphaera pollenicola]|nr:hypothetical protein KEM56_007251 [Ascosphaera pollenicola]